MAYFNPGFHHILPVVHILTYVFIIIIVILGLQWMGKVVFVTVFLPMVLLMILIFFTTTLDGHKEGLKFYLKTDFCRLKNINVWINVMNQVFFSLSIAHGGLTTLASYNKFNTDVFRSALIVVLSDFLFSFMAGLAVFGVIGFMAREMDVNIEDLLENSSVRLLAFVTLAQVSTLMPGKQFWAIMFFLSFTLTAVASGYVMMETLLTWLFDDYTLLRKYRYQTVAVVGIIGYLVGLPAISKMGVRLSDIADTATVGVVTLTSLGQIVMVAYLYGIENFIADVELMFGKNDDKWSIGPWIWRSPLKWYFTASLSIFAPLGMVVLFVAYMIESFKAKGGTIVPDKAGVFGYVTYVGILFFILPACLFGTIGYKLFWERKKWKGIYF